MHNHNRISEAAKLKFHVTIDRSWFSSIQERNSLSSSSIRHTVPCCVHSEILFMISGKKFKMLLELKIENWMKPHVSVFLRCGCLNSGAVCDHIMLKNSLLLSHSSLLSGLSLSVLISSISNECEKMLRFSDQFTYFLSHFVFLYFYYKH